MDYPIYRALYLVMLVNSLACKPIMLFIALLLLHFHENVILALIMFIKQKYSSISILLAEKLVT